MRALLPAILGLAALLLAGPSAPAASVPPPLSRDGLVRELERHLADPRFASSAWGVQIKSLDTGRLVFEHHSALRLKPASNAKLYTGALALEALGPEGRIHTGLLARRPPSSSGTLAGDLLVLGRGDFSLAARFHDGRYEAAMAPLVDAVAAAGVRRIRGDLVCDESYFRGSPWGSGWTWDDLQYYYGAAVSACTYQDNTVDLVVHPGPQPGAPCRLELQPFTRELHFINRLRTAPPGTPASLTVTRTPGDTLVYLDGELPADGRPQTEAVTVPRPARWFGEAFRRALEQRGITISGRVRTYDAEDRRSAPLDPAKWVELASVPSPPVSRLVAEMMKPSQNLYAQLLLLQVGARSAEYVASDRLDAEAAGIRQLNGFLQRIGVIPGDVLLDDGSGLSRSALVTPRATVKLLEHMHTHPAAAAFRAALPVAGVDGTLRARLKQTPAENNARAKTGTLRYVNTLAGYVTSAAGEPLVFALMLNQHLAPADGPAARADLDAIVVLLARLGERTAP